MKIVLISDTHNQHERLTLPPGDIIVHAGDITGNGTFRETLHFLQWFAFLPYANRVFIAGNHDFALENNEVPTSDLPNGVTYLENSMVSIDGLKIYGSPYTPEFFNWAFMKKRGSQIKKVWDLIPESVDILITHGPPLMILDQTIQGKHVGCEDLLAKVKQIKPKIHVFGHIHEANGAHEEFGIKFFNASILNHRYELVNQPIVIDI